MKILYVKSNSERDKKYQLQTIIFEENGEKFVKKKALCREAVPHLLQMKENYHALAASIIDPNIRLARIVAEESDSLTFEFIDGISMEQKILDAIRDGSKEAIEREINRYIELLKRGFRTKMALPQSLVTPEGKEIFNDLDFTGFGTTLCFDRLSNVDLIFSNIIYRDGTVYLIDYEWVFEGTIPLNFALFRAFRSLHESHKLPIENYFTDNERLLFDTMEKRLIFFEIMSANSFYQFRERFDKVRTNLYLKKSELEEEISSLKGSVSRLKNEVNELENETLFYALSNSWKITRPMRKILIHLRGIK
jgi:hypothetical protein